MAWDWWAESVPGPDPVASKNWYLCEFLKPLLWRTVLYNIWRAKLSEHFENTRRLFTKSQWEDRIDICSQWEVFKTPGPSWQLRRLLPQYFLLPQKIAVEKVFAAVCVSFQWSDWRSTCDHDLGTLCCAVGDLRDTNNQDRIWEQREGGETTDCEGGTYFTHWVVICQAFGPNYPYSDLISSVLCNDADDEETEWLRKYLIKGSLEIHLFTFIFCLS